MDTEKELFEATDLENTEAIITIGATAEPVPTKLDNILTLGLVGLLTLSLIVIIICKAVSKGKAATAVAEAPVQEIPEVPAATAPGSAGQLKLHDVEPKTAAMLMAIIADKMGKPLNELRFISIKEVK